MQRLKLFVTALMAILALTAVMASTAAAKPEFLDNVKGNTFTGKGKAGELTTLGSGIVIKCKENTLSGEVLDNEEGTIKDIDFKECTALGFPANSLGDASGVILTGAIPFDLCYINEATRHISLYFKTFKVHIEVPIIGVLFVIEGSIEVLITVANSLKTGPFTANFTQSAAGDPSFTKCTLLGKELKASLVASQDAKHEKNESAAIVQSDELTFAKDIQIDA